MASLFNPSVYQPSGLEPVRIVARRTGTTPSGQPTYEPFNYDVDDAQFAQRSAKRREALEQQAVYRRKYRANVFSAMADARDARRANAYEMRVRARALERRGLVVDARKLRREADQLEGIDDGTAQ